MPRHVHFLKVAFLTSLIGFSTLVYAAQPQNRQKVTDPIETELFQDEPEATLEWISPHPTPLNLRDQINQQKSHDHLHDRDDAEAYFRDWHDELEQTIPKRKEKTHYQRTAFEEQEFQPIDIDYSNFRSDSLQQAVREEDLGENFSDEEIEKENWRASTDHPLPLFKKGELKDHLFDREVAEEEKPSVLNFNFHVENEAEQLKAVNPESVVTPPPTEPSTPPPLTPQVESFAPARPVEEIQPAPEATPPVETPATVTPDAPAPVEAPPETPATPTEPPVDVAPQVETPSEPANTDPQPEIPPPSVENTPTTPAVQPVKESPLLFVPGQPIEEEPILHPPPPDKDKLIRVNFPNISIVELMRYIARESGKNFIFDENELLFNVTIISEEDTTIEHLMTAMLQELRIHGFNVIEQGNNVLVFPAQTPVNAISKVIDAHNRSEDQDSSEVVTRVFRLNTLNPDQATAVLTPLTSANAILTVIPNSNHLVITDLNTNISKMAQLIRDIDSPKSGVVIGQYVVKSQVLDVLIDNVQQIMTPIAQEQIITFVPHPTSNSVFIVSSPYLVEKSLQVMRYLDQNQASTNILESTPQSESKRGRWVLDQDGNWIFKPNGAFPGGANPPDGQWLIDDDGNWFFKPHGSGGTDDRLSRPEGSTLPDGSWEKDESGNWIYLLQPGKSISAKQVSRSPSQSTEGLPLGHIEKTRFTIFKLKYRKGEQVQNALRNIGETLQSSETANKELINTINSVQWIESSNSLIFTGSPVSLQKVAEFIQEIDVPLRQVFIEVLLLEMTLTDSLQYGVNWGTQMGGGNTASSETFSTNDSQLANILRTGDNTNGINTPAIVNLANSQGYRLGVIGQNLTRCGITFNSIAALVKAVHNDDDTRVLMNPKIFTEDNNSAELFVGLEVQYPTQSIASGDINNTITQNFETKEIGTKLTVTPQIGNNNVITLDILQEHSNIANAATQNATQSINTAGKTTTKSSTKTRVHVPNGFFVVLSGQIQDSEDRQRQNVPCLGGAPVLGGIFAEKVVTVSKRNLMIFIQPTIIDTEEQLDNLTQLQQNAYRNKSYFKEPWKYEVDEALDLLNVKNTGPNKQCEGCYSD